jgi:predicted SprT family Zn-dependent metalloprotease
MLKDCNGKWNLNLKGGPGWIFSNKHSKTIYPYIESLPVEVEEPINNNISTDVQWKDSLYRQQWVIDLWEQFKTAHSLLEWNLVISYQLTSSAGNCNYRKKTIKLSGNMIEYNNITQYNIQDTLLHEIAHALTFQQYGNKVAAHGKEWKRCAIDIGCTGERCHTIPFVKRRQRNKNKK